MNKQELIELIKAKKSFLCVGLDTDLRKIPKHLLEEEDPVFAFNKQIIDSTIDFAVAYKPNTAFYEANGSKGWASLEKTMNYLNNFKAQVFTIADAKRGDIGNTATQYAAAFFNHLDFDAVTVSPYMGGDSVLPFLEHKDKWVVILALTSNESARDLQYLRPQVPRLFRRLGIYGHYGKQLYEIVIRKSMEWGNQHNLMFVIGATKVHKLATIRSMIPFHFLLVPGIGAQGGSLSLVAHHGMNRQCGLLVNSSRGIIYASEGRDFGEKAKEVSWEIQHKMKDILRRKKIL